MEPSYRRTNAIPGDPLLEHWNYEQLGYGATLRHHDQSQTTKEKSTKKARTWPTTQNWPWNWSKRRCQRRSRSNAVANRCGKKILLTSSSPSSFYNSAGYEEENVGFEMKLQHIPSPMRPERDAYTGSGIMCTFDFQPYGADGPTYSRHLELDKYRHWASFAQLLAIILQDGFGYSNDYGFGFGKNLRTCTCTCIYIWDVAEAMLVVAGDWEARVRPGWEVIVAICRGDAFTFADCSCLGVKRGVENAMYEDEDEDEDDQDDKDDDEDEDEDDGKQEIISLRVGEEATGWFWRWRRKVEKVGFADWRKEETGWLVGVLGMVGVVGGFWVVVALDWG